MNRRKGVGQYRSLGVGLYPTHLAALERIRQVMGSSGAKPTVGDAIRICIELVDKQLREQAAKKEKDNAGS